MIEKHIVNGKHLQSVISTTYRVNIMDTIFGVCPSVLFVHVGSIEIQHDGSLIRRGVPVSQEEKP